MDEVYQCPSVGQGLHCQRDTLRSGGSEMGSKITELVVDSADPEGNERRVLRSRVE
jgi:hypothetical protein